MDKMLEQLTSMLAAIQSAASTELPLIAQQILEWDLMISIGWAILFAIIMVTLIIFLTYYVKSVTHFYDSDGFVCVLAIVLIGLVSICFASCAKTVLKIKYAPKVYLLDEVQSRLKSVRN